MFRKIPHTEMESQQPGSYRFHKVAARLADYGFTCVHLIDNWEEANCVARHIHGKPQLKLRILGRLTIDKDYCGKDIYVAFILGNTVHLYDHDRFLRFLKDDKSRTTLTSASWTKNGHFNWPSTPQWAIEFLEEHKILE